MFGCPYFEENLTTGIHDNLPGLFGPIPIAHYAHAAQNTLRGYAAPFNVEAGKPQAWEECLDLTGFENLQIGLVTGDRNILWHRESIDRMHDWLRRKLPAERCRKRVFAGYGHQDLFWGKNSAKDVFGELANLLQ
jgi:cholesterol oxidase